MVAVKYILDYNFYIFTRPADTMLPPTKRRHNPVNMNKERCLK